MKNGTSQAVLVADLFSGDGPHGAMADAYLGQQCSHCAAPVGDEARLSLEGFLCVRCARVFNL